MPGAQEALEILTERTNKHMPRHGTICSTQNAGQVLLGLGQWLAAFLMLQPFNAVPRAMAPNHEW